MKKLITVALAAAAVLALAGCVPDNIPKDNSVNEGKYLVACHKLGGYVILGADLPGSYRDACVFRYPNLPKLPSK